jgi:hypothetical protein
MTHNNFMPQPLPSLTIRAGLILFAVGIVFVLVDVLPFFAAARDRPLWLNLACLAAPLGFALAVGGALRAGRADQRRAVDEVARG